MQELLEPFVPWLMHYGSIAIFVLFALGIIALPVPEASLMVFAGFLMAKGTLAVFPTLIGAIGGALCGITGSYLIGKTAGNFLLQKYGRWIGITQHKLQRAHNWFERIGKWALLIGYFIPGVRHLTGYFAGSVRLDYKDFALFAYTGGIMWATLFLSIGYFFSDEWHSVLDFLHSTIISKLNFF